MGVVVSLLIFLSNINTKLGSYYFWIQNIIQKANGEKSENPSTTKTVLHQGLPYKQYHENTIKTKVTITVKQLILVTHTTAVCLLPKT